MKAWALQEVDEVVDLNQWVWDWFFIWTIITWVVADLVYDFTSIDEGDDQDNEKEC